MSVRASEVSVEGSSIYSYDPKGKAAFAYMALTKEVLKEAGQPLNAGKIAELSGLDRKEVDAAMKQLKAEGAIVSPVRCKWAPAE